MNTMKSKIYDLGERSKGSPSMTSMVDTLDQRSAIFQKMNSKMSYNLVERNHQISPDTLNHKLNSGNLSNSSVINLTNMAASY